MLEHGHHGSAADDSRCQDFEIGVCLAIELELHFDFLFHLPAFSFPGWPKSPLLCRLRKMRQTASLHKTASAIVVETRRFQHLPGVTFQLELKACGKRTCRCAAEPCHGPYWYRYEWRKGKRGPHSGRMVSTYIGRELKLRWED